MGREVALYMLQREGGLSLRVAGRCIGLTNYYAAAQALRRFTRRIAQDKVVQRLVAEVSKCIKIQT